MRSKKYALVCLPADTLDRALRMEDSGNVDIAKAKEQHRMYCRALESLGFNLLQMSKDDQYPDSVFVEDPSVIIQDILTITRLRRKERRGEEKGLEDILTPFFSDIFRIEEPGFIEGGDVLVTDDRLYIGLSARTNIEGAEQLAKIALDRCGILTDIFEIPQHFLHLKGGVSFHGYGAGGISSTNIITVTEEIAHHFVDSSCHVVVVPSEERFGANCISANGQVLIHAERVKTRAILEKIGFSVLELQMSEFEKIDGALSCLSKLFKAKSDKEEKQC